MIINSATPPEIFIFTANKWLCDHLIYFLSDEFDVSFAFAPEHLSTKMDPQVVITDYSGEELAYLTEFCPSAPIFLLLGDEVREEDKNIVKHVRYPINLEEVIEEVKEFVFNLKKKESKSRAAMMTTIQIQLALTELRLQRHSIEVQMIDVEEQIRQMNFYEREGATAEMESTLYRLKMNLKAVDDEIARLEGEIGDLGN